MPKVSDKLAESSSYNLMGVYFTFILGILNTFFIARLLLPEKWAIIILTINLVYICVFVCNLFPPNAQDSIKYYIPHLISLEMDENTGKRRNFISHVFKIRFLSCFIVYIIYILIAFIANLESVILEIILIMSPMILFDIFKNLNKAVLLAFQKFKKAFIIDITYSVNATVGLFLIYYYRPDNPLNFVAYSYLIASIISFIVSIILIIPILPAKKRYALTSPQYKQDFLLVHKKYGAYLTLSDVFIQISYLVVYFLFINYSPIYFITWLTILEISVSSALYFSSANPSVYVSIFSEINYQKDPETFISNFYKLNKFLMLFVCVIVGIMIFFVEIYISIIYSDQYLILILWMQIYLITTFSRIIIKNLFILTQSTNNTMLNAKISFIQMIFNITSAIFALIFFSLRALLILFLLNSFLIVFIAFYFVNKKLDIKLKSLFFFKPLIIFIASFIIVFPFVIFVNFTILRGYHFSNIFINDLINFILFVIVFYILFYFTRVLTKEEFNQLVDIVPILHSKNKIIQKFVQIIEKFLPSEKKK